MVRRGCIAIIPARGGSKRIKGKNIIDFYGRPMIAWSIQAAQKSGLFKRILVSTDDSLIAEVAIKYGVEVPFLRTKCTDDYSTVSQATIFALQQAEDFWDEKYEFVVQLMANCPLRTEEDILAAWNYFRQYNLNFQISCFRYGWMNPWWAVRLNDDFVPSKLFPDTGEKRSQDLDVLYCPTGAIWIANCKKLCESGTFYGLGYRMFPMDWKRAVDIDNYDDLEFAKILYEQLASRNKKC